MSVAELMVQRGMVSASAVEEAHRRRQQDGGTLESHLLRLKAVTERDLCEALSLHYGCDAPLLRHLPIPQSVLDYIPGALAEQKSILPLAFDSSTGCLTVACLDPSDLRLVEDLKTASGMANIRLVAAAEPILRCRIVEAYRNTAREGCSSVVCNEAPPSASGYIMLVGPINSATEALAEAFSAEGRRVILVDTVEEALAEAASAVPRAVVVLGGEYESRDLLRDGIRKLSPGCPVRFSSRVAELAESDLLSEDILRLVAADLELVASLLCSDDELELQHVARMPRLVQQLCDRLALSPRDRLLVVNAAFLASLADCYLGEDEAFEWKQPGGAGIPAGRWPSELASILAARACDIDDQYPDRLPLSVLGGNILRIAGFFADRQDLGGPVTPECYQAVRTDLWPRRGREFLPEVADAFLGLLAEQVAGPTTRSRGAVQVLLLSDDGYFASSLMKILEPVGFEVLAAGTTADLVALYRRHWPESLLLVARGPAQEVRSQVEDLGRKGVALDTVSTLLVVRAEATRDLADLLESRIADLLPIEGGPELAVARLLRLRTGLESEHSRRMCMLQAMGTHGTLADMNLIDLLQALGHAQRTVRISVTASGSQLTMCLDNGQLAWAECEDRVGAEAVYLGLGWSNGIWSVDPVRREELPTDNGRLSIDALLIEGCHRLDEGQSVPSTEPGEIIPEFAVGESDIQTRRT